MLALKGLAYTKFHGSGLLCQTSCRVNRQDVAPPVAGMTGGQPPRALNR